MYSELFSGKRKELESVSVFSVPCLDFMHTPHTVLPQKPILNKILLWSVEYQTKTIFQNADKLYRKVGVSLSYPGIR